MPTINEMQYGYDTEGVNAFLEAIKAEALNEASEQVKDISEIKTCCENNWEGKARENFVHNLEQDSKYVADQFERLYNILIQEIQSVNAAMANKDEELIKSDSAAIMGTMRNQIGDMWR